ncbi:MAG TPA: hypothetical protein VGR96_15875 [Acidobacteriaceae bacterium]|nr:hypothetical protein [Acidobacteriaceae bacterium]
MALRPPPDNEPIVPSLFASISWKRWFRELWNSFSTDVDPQNPVNFEQEMTRDTDLRDRVNSLEAQMIAGDTTPPYPDLPEWQPLASLYQNGWTDVPSYQTGQYTIDRSGNVQVRCAIQPGTLADGTTLFSLPSSCCPQSPLVFPVYASHSGTILVAGLILYPSGPVQIHGVSGGVTVVGFTLDFSIY